MTSKFIGKLHSTENQDRHYLIFELYNELLRMVLLALFAVQFKTS